MFLLGVAAFLSLFFKDWKDGLAILIVIFINAGVGFWMEFKASKAMELLRKMVLTPASVLREGQICIINQEEVVPGDILLVEAGEVIAADARIAKSVLLKVNESSLTGESLPVEKIVCAINEETILAERANMLFKGTHVITGNATAVVTATGMKTELGLIAGMIQEADDSNTPLEKKIGRFSVKLIWVTLSLVVVIFFAGILNGHDLIEMLQTSIALFVAAIPEGLPIVTTLSLAFGMIRMAKKKVIVKKLSSVETLGNVSVICTDKTGTLTENRIEAGFIGVDGMQSGISLEKNSRSIKWLDEPKIAVSGAFAMINKIGALCNTASLVEHGGAFSLSGDPLEVALINLAYYSGIDFKKLQIEYPKEDELPFTSETRMMVTVHRGDGYFVAVKGALEEVISCCSSLYGISDMFEMDHNKKQEWLQIGIQKASMGLRILAFAYKKLEENESWVLDNLTFAGIVGFVDPLRSDVSDAIRECATAGIKVVMMTGDHPATAATIAMQLGLAASADEVIHGRNMKPYHQLTEDDRDILMKATVFARVTPLQKLDLVSLYQDQQMVVGMTGDGVNDAPALKKSDIGIAMGERGTQVAQDVADMVLKDDSFSTIVLAVKQGRVIFDNIRKFVMFLISCNLSEMFIVSTVAVLNLKFQLLPLQILYINLVTDVLPALALGVTKAAPHVMTRNPYLSTTPVIDAKRWLSIIVYAIVITATTVAAVFTSYLVLHKKWEHEVYNSILFYSLIFSQLLNVFNMSFVKPVKFWHSEVARNRFVWYSILVCTALALIPFFIPVFAAVLGLHPCTWQDWIIIIGYSFLALAIIQLLKRKWIF